jgi:hypothetical protein
MQNAGAVVLRLPSSHGRIGTGFMGWYDGNGHHSFLLKGAYFAARPKSFVFFRLSSNSWISKSN